VITIPNPFAFVEEIREMNLVLCDKLDEILDQLILLTDIIQANKADLYGDGK
jgi:hypothetical protein